MYAVAIFVTAMSLATLYFLAFIEDKIQGRKSYSYALAVTNLNQALSRISSVLQDNSVTTASFNFKKKAGFYRLWFKLLIPRETNIRIIQQLSQIPEITQLETGNSHDTEAGHSNDPGDQGGQVA
jgi:uncharacterized membrane protein YhiD involved in acid resistance